MPTINLDFDKNKCQVKVTIGVLSAEEVGKPAQLDVIISGASTMHRNITLDNKDILFEETPQTGKTHTINASLTSEFGTENDTLPNVKLCATITTNNFLILPTRGLELNTQSKSTRDFLSSLSVGVSLANSVADNVITPSLPPEAVVLDSTDTMGVKLIQISEGDLVTLRALQPEIRIVKEEFYYPQRYVLEITEQAEPQAVAMAVAIRVRFIGKKNKQPIVGATIVAFTNFAQRIGEGGSTDANGEVIFSRIGGQQIEQLYVYPKDGFWTFFKKNITLNDGNEFKLQALTANFVDAKDHFYAPSSATDGTGVRVGVIDTGIGPHTDLIVAGGGGFPQNNNPADFNDIDQHGTHVAGIIAAQGNGPLGIKGLAPGVTLFAYRVFSRAVKGASNFAIIKAIERAVADGCHLVNMSLGGGPVDPGLQDAITFAQENGMLCLVATGNDSRQPVSFPASFSSSIAIGAMGRKKTFPANTTDQPNIKAPFGSDSDNFVAAFSNIGPDVDLIAPGVGIVSTVPSGYAPMSGTSMACPAATGMAARLLATQPAILAMLPTAARSTAMRQFLSSRAKSLGFGPLFEGLGQLA